MYKAEKSKYIWHGPAIALTHSIQGEGINVRSFLCQRNRSFLPEIQFLGF